MAWIRLSDDYNDHPKFDNLSDGAFRLWHQAIGFCRKFRTDGLIPIATVRKFKAYSPKRAQELETPWRGGEQPLWHGVEGFGIRVHDYLEWNLSKEEEEQQREESKRRMALGRDPDLRRRLHERDGNLCRYCARTVNWTDRRGPSGATYDHVDPRGSDTFDNLVIACRGCNSSKGSRTPAEAGMVLRPPPKSQLAEPELRFKSRPESKPSSLSDISGSGSGMDLLAGKGSGENPLEVALAERAGRLREELYPAWYAKYRHGAKLRLVASSLEFNEALTLVETWDDARLEKLARIVLTTDDPWISGTDRSFRIFAMKASWADDRLRQAEMGAA